MNTSRTTRAYRRFGCLIALLLFVGAVVALLKPANYVIGAGSNSPIFRIKRVMKDLQFAAGYFRAEYNAFPVPSKDTKLLSQGRYLAALLGENLELNPRKIKFLDGLPQATDGRGGLLKVEDDQRLVDRWGEMYHIILDTNEDNRIANPELEADPTWVKKHAPPALLNTTSLIYSSGPDRDPKTWEDNVCSWR